MSDRVNEKVSYMVYLILFGLIWLDLTFCFLHIV